MSLQGYGLKMIALGMLNDTPPVPDQPALADGVHLRWTAPRDRLFPWYGYYLYRRDSNDEKLSGCLDLDRLAKHGLQQTEVSFPDGRISSSQTLRFEDSFAPVGTVELAVRNTQTVQFDRPADRPAYLFRLRIGFHASTKRHCLNFAGLDRRDLKLPFTFDGLEFQAGRRRAGTTPGRLILGAEKPGRGSEDWGLALSGVTEVTLPAGTLAVEGLCCTNPVRDLSCESSAVAGLHEQTYIPCLQDPELACI